jgi:hypothetical protein
MDNPSEIKRRALAGRLHWILCAGVSLQVERPTELAWDSMVQRFARGEAGIQEGSAAERAFRGSARFVHGWSGVTFGDIFPDSDLSEEEASTEAPFDPELLDILIQQRPDVGGDLFKEVKRLYGERREREDEAEKKPVSGSTSPSESSSSEPAGA